MKKMTVFLLLLLLFLTACQTVSDGDDEYSDSTSLSHNITFQTDEETSPTDAPSTMSTGAPPTNPPITEDMGYVHIHEEGNSPLLDAYDLSDCVVGYLYWLDKDTNKVVLLLAEQISCCISEGQYIYCVKEAEPTKVHRFPIADPSQSELVHETAHGKMSDLIIYPGVENYLQFIADDKKFVVLEFNTGKETVLLEQEHIAMAYIEGIDGTLGNRIWFEGKPTNRDLPYEQYFYYRDTGEIKVDKL